jgi:hypothetical protein
VLLFAIMPVLFSPAVFPAFFSSSAVFCDSRSLAAKKLFPGGTETFFALAFVGVTSRVPEILSTNTL